MNVGVCKVKLRFPENQSLKDKRRVVSSLCSRIHYRFNVAIAEVTDNHAWQIAALGITCVSNSSQHAEYRRGLHRVYPPGRRATGVSSRSHLRLLT